MSTNQRFQGEHTGSAGKIADTKALTPVEKLRTQIIQMGPEFSKVLPEHVTVEKFTRVVMTAIQKDANLVRAEPSSLFEACVRCATDGLIPDGREAALTTFGGKAVYMPMVGGILKKVRNSGELASITAQVIHKNDSFRYWVDGDGEHLTHEPLLFGERGEMIGVYALAKTKDGDVYIEPMTIADVDKVRKVSKAQSGPWKDWYDEMAKKTAIRRLSKRLPMSTDLEDVIRRDDHLTELKDVTPKTNSIQDRLAEIPSTHNIENVSEISHAIEKENITHSDVIVPPNTTLTYGRFSGMPVGSIPKEELVAVYNALKAADKNADPAEERTETIEILRLYLGFMK